MSQENQLKDWPVHHAGRRLLVHPELKREVPGQTAVRYLRFAGTARVDLLELPVEHTASGSGRWVPNVPTHPAHLFISILDPRNNRWRTVKEVNLPPNPKFAGKGLSQEMPIAAMEAFFKEAVAASPAYRIPLDGIETDCLRVECDREHPVWPNHGECNGGPFNVPFGLLQNLRAFGRAPASSAPPVYRRKLERTGFSPAAPPGMAVNTRNPLEIVFQGDRLTVGFSLIRPMLTRLNWNYFGNLDPRANRLVFRRTADALGGLNGPSFITPAGNFIAQNISGKVEVTGNRVRYFDLDTGCGVRLDALFTVTAGAITLELEQQAAADLPALEAETWRLLWNMRAGLTSVAGAPIQKEGRNGFVDLPALITADDGACLAVRLVEGVGALHTESYRQLETRSCGFVLAEPDTTEAPLMIRRGRTRAVFALEPTVLLPESTVTEAALSDGIRTCWAAGFSTFRPEFGGFSNNAISTNCHVNQHTAFDFAAFTARPAAGPDPLALVEFSLGRALLDGGGYGYHRCLYLDSDPILLAGAGRLCQRRGNPEWLAQVGPGIIAAAERILGNFDPRAGMIVCRALSGNSGTHRWSSNAMDVIGFGHIDAYVNAWSFRALKNAAALCRRLGNPGLADRCAQVAAALRENYVRQLVNPETGWVSGWKSRDGQHHDFGFLWINGVACAFGVMDDTSTRRALANLEAKRREVFPESGYQGLPLNLLPIAPADHMLAYPFAPTYENYTDGALSPCFAAYYLRALAAHGFNREAREIVDCLDRGFADGRFHGPYGTGREFANWTGADSGYEGTFGPNSGPLYAIGVEYGFITPPDPEWWLAE